MKTILVTGGAGFIGSNFILYFMQKYPAYKIINLDLLTYAADLENLSSISRESRYKFIQGDIGNFELIDYIFKEYNIEGVINFAAESHVDNSIKEPSRFIKTNVLGTQVLLDVARKNWMSEPFKYKDKLQKQPPRFHHISTDEVYGTLGKTGFFTEKTPYAPNSPYSASKAASDFLVRSYVKTYGLNCVLTNCSNNYGPHQHDEKLIPTIIRNALSGNPIPIYGDGKNVRDWLFVEDHCRAIDLVFHTGKLGETYNIGGNNEVENIQIARLICNILDEIKPRLDGTSYKEQITFVKDRPGHDFRYAIKSDKIKNELGFTPEVDFKTGLRKTVAWYLDKYSKMEGNK